MDLFQDLVSFDVVPWYLTEQDWLSLSLNPEQQALVNSRTVTSIGKDVPRASQTHHLLKVELRIHGHTHTHNFTLLFFIENTQQQLPQFLLAWKNLSIPIFHLKEIRTVVTEMAEQVKVLATEAC